MGTTPYKTLSVRVRVCIRAKRAIVSAPLLSNDTSGTCSSENGQTNTHSLSPSSIFLFHTHTHRGSHRNFVLYCWGEGESALRFTASPWNAGTSELWSAKKTRGVVKEGRVVRKPQELKRPPMGWLFICILCGCGCVLTSLEKMGSYLPLIYLFLCPLQAGDRPGQLQSNPSLNGGGVQTIHFPVSLSRPRTGKGREHRRYKSVQKEFYTLKSAACCFLQSCQFNFFHAKASSL